MRVSSDISAGKRRTPQQQRGERRVAELLEAAAAVFAETGYEAATMTEIAERAGASIGAVYQYFPNKEAIARELRTLYADKMDERWANLQQADSNASISRLAGRLVDTMIHFAEEHPAYFRLLDVPLTYKRDRNARKRLRDHFAGLFCRRNTFLSYEEAFRIANITVEILKSMKPVYAEASPQERPELIREYKLVLTAYLEKAVDGPPRNSSQQAKTPA